MAREISPFPHPPPPPPFRRGRSYREKNETIHGSLEWDYLKPDYCAAPSTLNPNSLRWVEGSVYRPYHTSELFFCRGTRLNNPVMWDEVVWLETRSKLNILCLYRNIYKYLSTSTSLHSSCTGYIQAFLLVKGYFYDVLLSSEVPCPTLFSRRDWDPAGSRCFAGVHH
jgi:hypothetical protein